jgi:NDP-sugar pyrophosphorylase family protein
MRPLTETVPKSMLEVAGKPFIAHQLDLFRREGIAHVVICAGHLSEKMRDYVGDGTRWNLKVDWSFDGDILLGTGGALKRALSYLTDTFFVTYGDSWLDIPYRPIVEAFAAAGKPALMTVYRNEGRWDASNVEFENGNILSYDKSAKTDKMRYIDYGLQLISRDILAAYPPDTKFDLAEIYTKMVRSGQMAGYEAGRRFYEIGSPQGLAETDTLLRGTSR